MEESKTIRFLIIFSFFSTIFINDRLLTCPMAKLVKSMIIKTSSGSNYELVREEKTVSSPWIVRHMSKKKVYVLLCFGELKMGIDISPHVKRLRGTLHELLDVAQGEPTKGHPMVLVFPDTYKHWKHLPTLDKFPASKDFVTEATFTSRVKDIADIEYFD
jgi:hypothetical protein